MKLKHRLGIGILVALVYSCAMYATSYAHGGEASWGPPLDIAEPGFGAKLSMAILTVFFFLA